MPKLVYINSCIRKEESRTLKIATPIIEALKEKYDVFEVDVNSLELDVIDYEKYHKRMNGYVREDILDLAKRIADADRIVIAAPFWDMSFPSKLKALFEQCSLFRITFADDGNGCYGLCKADKALYITTRGGNFPTGSEFEQATPYIKALFHLWGVKSLEVIDAYNMDYSSLEEIQEKIDSAIKQGLKLAETF